MKLTTTQLSSNGATYFSADHHLWPGELPASLIRFCDHLKTGDAWWILGDFFEVWLENHWCERPDYKEVLTLIKALTQMGVEVRLLVGNRDFAAGKKLISACGIKVHQGALLFEAFGQKHMVIHGDELLPSDRSYQQFKKVVRNPLLKATLKTLPMPWLTHLAGKTRSHSRMKLDMIPGDRFKLDCSLIRKVCEANHIDKCWAGHLHFAQSETFQLKNKPMVVEILPHSTTEHLNALVWRDSSPPEYRVWS